MMALKLGDIISDDVRALIRALTGFEENQENFQACERFILSNLLYHRYMSVNRHAVRRSMEGMVMKFQVHGLHEKSQELGSLVKQFLECCDFETVDMEWCMLSLLLQLGQNPTNILRKDQNTSQSSISFVTDDGSDFDWVSYLREGEEEFFNKWDSPSDEDEVDHMAIQAKESTIYEPSFPSKAMPDISPVTSTSEKHTLIKATEGSSHKPTVAINAQNVLTAECWLKKNVQHGWWTKAFISHKPLSDHPFSQTALLLDRNSKDRIKTSTLSEHKVVLETIWLLAAPCDTTVFMRVISEDGRKTHFSVRPHVTAPSILPVVFSSFMSSVCACADMVDELQTFCSKLFDANAQKKVCSTYEAYSYALQSELKPLFETLSQLEQQAHKQSESLTLLILQQKLASFTSTVTSLHKLHKSAVLDWRGNANWLCATHLLSVILSSLRNAEENVGINFRIFVQTFRVYMKIIDQWLTGGQLYDARDEFFIQRMEKRNSSLGATFEIREWEKENAALGVESPRALRVLAHCLLKAAQPLHVLCELNRLSELRKHTSSKCSIMNMFFQNLIGYLEVSQHIIKSDENTEKEENIWWKRLDYPLSEETASETQNVPLTSHIAPIDVKAVMSHLQRQEEPLLMKDFQALFCHSQKTPTSRSQCEKEENCLLDKVLILSNSVMEHIPLESCIEKAVRSLTADWDGIAGTIVADILMQERQLLHHMQIAQSVFLLQAYYKLLPFVSHIFKLILHRTNSMWKNSHTLSVLLQDRMDSDQFTFSVMVEDGDQTPINALECFDCMQITYQVEWPLCAIMGEKSHNSYNFVFRLLLKIRWGLWLVEDLDLRDFKHRDSSEVSRRLLHLRYWLLHVIRGSYNFLAGHVLNCLWLKFEEDIKCSKDMHSIIEVHRRFLDDAVHQSLFANHPDSIKSALFQLVVLAENLHTLWNCKSSKVSLSKLSNIEECYSQCHRFLAASLHSLAEEEGLQHLVVLSDLFNCNLPKDTTYGRSSDCD